MLNVSEQGKDPLLVEGRGISFSPFNKKGREPAEEGAASGSGRLGTSGDAVGSSAMPLEIPSSSLGSIPGKI